MSECTGGKEVPNTKVLGISLTGGDTATAYKIQADTSLIDWGTDGSDYFYHVLLFIYVSLVYNCF